MRNITGIFVLVLMVNLTGCKKAMETSKGQQEIKKSETSENIEKREAGTDMKTEEDKQDKLEIGTYAVMSVKHGVEKLGDIVIKLYPEKTPITVQNFVELAEGTKEFVDMKTGEKKKGRYYDGLIFHRVIPNFMIQGGDPSGTGRGGPGYKFQDEIVADLKFDSPGILAMANAGPNTNGSQFFITLAPTPWLNSKHTIFGKVVEGQDIINKISVVPTAAGDKPVQPVVMEKVTIKRVQ